ncbi:MAG TPA: hypothetical protein VIV60_18585, partial [Polyangiaceae bacterium]
MPTTGSARSRGALLLPDASSLSLRAHGRSSKLDDEIKETDVPITGIAGAQRDAQPSWVAERTVARRAPLLYRV